MKSKLILALATSLLVVGPGCISTHETVYRDVERIKVEFETPAAAGIFYEALNRHSPKQASESRTEVHIPIIFEHTRTEKDSGNTAFNQAVRRCDSNQDGRITEAEARIYADQH